MEFKQLEVQGNVSPVGWDTPTDLTHDDWRQIGDGIRKANKKFKWFIADWIRSYSGKWGDKYTEAEELTGLSNQRLRNLNWLGESIELSRRRDNLGLKHHEQVAKFEPDKQTHWLDLAEENNWSARALSEAIRENEKPNTISDDKSIDVKPKTPMQPTSESETLETFDLIFKEAPITESELAEIEKAVLLKLKSFDILESVIKPDSDLGQRFYQWLEDHSIHSDFDFITFSPGLHSKIASRRMDSIIKSGVERLKRLKT